MSKNILRFLILVFCATSYSLAAEVHGKVDVGPTFLSVDLLKSGKTEETIRMYGFKADSTLCVYQGIALKPSLMLAWGQGRLVAGSIAAGYYLPITKEFKILPNVGMNWSYLSTHLDIEEASLYHLRERFRSSSPFVGIDLCYSINPKWTIIGCYQYAWCKTYTKIEHVANERSHSSGSNYSLGMEYSYNDQFSFNFGVGYNISLSKEKHGLRGKGFKLGAAYYF